MLGELVASSGPDGFSMEVNGRGAKRGKEREKGEEEGKEKVEVARLTRCGEGVVVRAQAQEEEERGEPDADREERRHLSERWGLHHGPAAIRLARGVVRVLREAREVEEPNEVVHDDEDARGDEGVGGEGDERP